MRIILDLQSCQTEGSKNRGIGRYSISLAEAMIRQGQNHEFFVILNGAFPDSARDIRARLGAILPVDRIKTFDIITPCAQAHPQNAWRHKASIALREDFIASLNPDAIHITSLFEGLGDNSLTEIPPPSAGVIRAVTLYDLIPYIKPVPYLESPQVRDWYYRRLQSLKRADLLLAISSSSQEEAIDYLHIPSDRVVNISSAIDAAFGPVSLSAQERAALLAKHGLGDSFVMYTGGIDHRKNIEGLIEAYAKLPALTRKSRQLAIICSVRDEQRAALLSVARHFGLGEGEVVLTGYVSEEDLIGLYTNCELFVFPSLHEGFGLPVLEAMACGAPTIGADNSSIPEVIDLAEALFDAADPAAIAAKMQQVLDDPDFAARLKQHGLRQSRNFSWDTSAQTALAAIEAAHAKMVETNGRSPQVDAPPRLALVAPLPPLRTGIANYTAELLPELCRHYDVDIITDQETVSCPWATANCEIVSVADFEPRVDAGVYDRIVYQVGNSEFHSHMPDLIARHPGVVVLHDFFLSGLQNWRQAMTAGSGYFINALVDTHGYSALSYFMSEGVMPAITRYPANGPIVEAAAGLIVHSRSSAERLGRDFGLIGTAMVRHIPHLRTRPVIGREQARAALGLTKKDFLICSFGILAPEKKNDLLVAAFGLAGLAGAPRVRLVFVGSAPGEYGEDLARQISDLGDGANVTITGYADDETYINYLAASDLAVQLRGSSRGETSGAVLDVLNYGVPLIVNAHGTMAEVEKTAALVLPDQVEAPELADALKSMVGSAKRRKQLSAEAKRVIRENHAPSVAGRMYHEAIETFAMSHPLSRQRRLVRRMARDQRTAGADIKDLAHFAEASAIIPHRQGLKRLFVDISLAMTEQGDPDRRRWTLAIIDAMLLNETEWRIEPVYIADGDHAAFRSARSFMVRRMGWGGPGIDDQTIAPVQGDCFLGLDSSAHSIRSAERRGLFSQWRARGVAIKFVVQECDIGLMRQPAAKHDAPRDERFAWLDGVAMEADEIVTTSTAVAYDVLDMLDTLWCSRSEPLPISGLVVDANEDGAGLVHAVASPSEPTCIWTPQSMFRFDGADSQILTQVGERQGRSIASTGAAGFLVHGPYAALPPGAYECHIWGTVGAGGGGSWFDVTIHGGRTLLTKIDMRDEPINDLAPGMIGSTTFSVEDGCRDLEVRLWVDEGTEITFRRLTLRPVDLSDGSMDLRPTHSPELA